MIRALFLFMSLFMLLDVYGQSDTCQNRPEDRFRVLFLLDASHSMGQKWDNKPLWEIAKKTIEEFSFFLQKNYNVEMGLRVYGHNAPVSANDCFDSKLEVPIEENSAKKIVAKLRTIQYKGTTPLTYSLEQAADDLGCNSKKKCDYIDYGWLRNLQSQSMCYGREIARLPYFYQAFNYWIKY